LFIDLFHAPVEDEFGFLALQHFGVFEALEFSDECLRRGVVNDAQADQIVEGFD
jgi:hypothetical protein